jgi:hypothetical protein
MENCRISKPFGTMKRLKLAAFAPDPIYFVRNIPANVIGMSASIRNVPANVSVMQENVRKLPADESVAQAGESVMRPEASAADPGDEPGRPLRTQAAAAGRSPERRAALA